MARSFNFLNCLCLSFLFGCATISKYPTPTTEYVRADLEQKVQEALRPLLPDEKGIRQDLERFKSTLRKKKELSAEHWTLHDRLLDYYIQLKHDDREFNTVVVPARSRWTKKIESYCLDSRKAPPHDNEKFLWIQAQNKIPYLDGLLALTSKNKTLSQEDLQTLIWNLSNRATWEDYPTSLQQALLLVDPQASRKLPTRLSGAIKNDALNFAREQLPSQGEGIVSLVQGQYYSYSQIRASIERRKSEHDLRETDSVPQVQGTPLFADTKSDSFEKQEVTFYNPTDRDVVLNFSHYQLEPIRPDIQPLVLLERMHLYSPALASDLERTLYDEMTRMGAGFTPGLNDLIDLFEVSTGRDFFNDNWLSGEDRFLSAIGILAGSGQHYRYAKKIISGPASYVRDIHQKYRRLKNAENFENVKALVDSIHEKKINIPDDWTMTPSKVKSKKGKLQGVEFRHPDNKDVRIRIMPGDPNSPHLNSRRPYVRQSTVKTNFDRYGNIVDRESDASHIPLDEYQFIEFWKNHEKK